MLLTNWKGKRTRTRSVIVAVVGGGCLLVCFEEESAFSLCFWEP